MKRNFPRLRAFGTVLLVGLSSLVLWVGIEGTITVLGFGRSLFLERHRAGYLHHQPIFQFHDTLGWVPKPDLDLPNGMGPDRPVTTNSKGHRQTGPDAGNNGLRVLCSGDSFTFGDRVGDLETWCARLSGTTGVAKTVNNGVSGYGLDQSYLRHRARRLAHDVHLWGMILDDVTRMKSPQSPFGPLKPTLALQNDQLSADTTWLDTSAPFQWILRRLYLADRLPSVRLLQKTVTSPYGASTEEWEHLFQLTGAIFEQTDQDPLGGRLIVLLFPTRHDMFHGKRPEKRRMMLQLLNDLGIEYVDFYERFETYPFSEVETLYLGDGHFSAEGHRAVASEVSKRIQGGKKNQIRSAALR